MGAGLSHEEPRGCVIETGGILSRQRRHSGNMHIDR